MILLSSFILCSLSLTFFLMALFSTMLKNKLKMDQRVSSLTSPALSNEKTTKKKQKQKPRSKIASKLIEKVGSFLSSRMPAEKRKALEKKIQDAGFSYSSAFFKTVQCGIGLGFFFLILLLFGAQSKSVLQLLFLSGIAGIFGFVYPMFYLNAKRNQRILAIEKTMSDFFDMVNVTIEAGLGLDAALYKVSHQMRGPLSIEMLRSLNDMKLGKSKKESFTELRDRVPSEAFQTVINALIQADQMGIGMTKVLKAQTQRIREQRRQSAREKAMKAPVKMMIPMVLFIFPTLFVILLGPIVIQLATEWL